MSKSIAKTLKEIQLETSDLSAKEGGSKQGLLTCIAKMFNSFRCCFTQSNFQPSEQTSSLAKECVGQGCGVHLFVLSQQDVGGAWPGHIPYLTGGTLLTYNHLQVY